MERKLKGHNQMPVRIPLSNLGVVNPYEYVVWQGLEAPITQEEIAQAIESEEFEKDPLPDSPARTLTRKEHIARIAYLATNGWDDAIHFDVGVPSLGCFIDWPLVDGNHRLAAAIYRGDKDILADVSGSTEYAKEVLGVNI